MAKTGVKAPRGKAMASSNRAASISILASSRRPGLRRSSLATAARSTRWAKARRGLSGARRRKAARSMWGRGARTPEKRWAETRRGAPAARLRAVVGAKCLPVVRVRRGEVAPKPGRAPGQRAGEGPVGAEHSRRERSAGRDDDARREVQSAETFVDDRPHIGTERLSEAFFARRSGDHAQ